MTIKIAGRIGNWILVVNLDSFQKNPNCHAVKFNLKTHDCHFANLQVFFKFDEYDDPDSEAQKEFEEVFSRLDRIKQDKIYDYVNGSSEQ